MSNLGKTKFCYKCKTLKRISEYHRSKSRYDGLNVYCKKCMNACISQWSKNNKDKRKKYTYTWRKKHRKQFNEYVKKWRQGKSDFYEKRKIYRQNNPQIRIVESMRSAIRRVLRGQKKKAHWETLVGYNIEDLRNHLESQFTDGMTWENYGKWHIDHIIPVSVFNFDSPEQIDFKRCWALENLQPMWAEENLAKNAKLSKHFQPMLKLKVG